MRITEDSGTWASGLEGGHCQWGHAAQGNWRPSVSDDLSETAGRWGGGGMEGINPAFHV